MADQGIVIERELRIEARPETVFAFLTQPAKMVRWMGLRAKLDPRPGGIYQVDTNGKDIVQGEYVEVVPYSRVVMTFGWRGENSPIPPGSSRLEFVLTPEGEGTLLRFRHSGITPSTYEGHDVGWDHYLPRLVSVSAGRDAGPDPWESGRLIWILRLGFFGIRRLVDIGRQRIP